MKTIKNRFRQLTKCDIAAAVLGVLLFVYFAATVRYSVAMLDEASLWLLGERMSFGDRLITDEWHLIQFSALINVPFYLLYTRIVGSTAGLILFTRCAFIVFDALFYIMMYKRLRRFQTAGVAAAFLFCAMVPELFFAFSYCTVSNFALMWLILALFIDDRPKSPARLIGIGVLLAVTVLEDPLFLLVFILWALFAAVYAAGNRLSKKPFLAGTAFLLEKRSFLLVTLGSVFVFIVFMAVLLFNGAFDEIKTVLPYLFSGGEYNKNNLFNADQLMQAVNYYNKVFIVGLLCCVAAAATVRAAKVKNRGVKLAVFLLSCAFFAACCIHGGVKMIGSREILNMTRFCQVHNLPLLLFAPVPFLLSEKTDARLNCALICGFLYSLLMDIPSQSFIGMGGFIVRSVLILQLRAFFLSLRQQKPAAAEAPPDAGKKRGVRAAGVLIAACLCACLCWDGMYIGAEGFFKAPERLFLLSDQPYDHPISKGPLKGLVTTRELGEIYDATLRDMDVIREDPDCAVAMLDSVAFAYLYAECPFATYSMSYSGEFDRLLAYWRLPFTTKPDYLYLPYYNPYLMFRYNNAYLNAVLSEVRSGVDCEVIRGEAGYIIRVNAIL